MQHYYTGSRKLSDPMCVHKAISDVEANGHQILIINLTAITYYIIDQIEGKNCTKQNNTQSYSLKHIRKPV